ncbi:Gibberellin 3-beta-dioxygenase 3 [Hibiscus syriacus]|uniref:gibberellin 3beta-dioxygenase n=1 Tax=Hibiscus syriacus TaxID=106335 RepID=A0A6A2ZJN9_HIBSY|nr:gibberellin 3-beta-dioxygenase 3-like [Hibiscus syriacus]KAE8691362.1 Gibberellin 3-beta-dioxygenase 3 [Hibiscus syriacus]
MKPTMNSQTQTFNYLLPLDFDNVSTLPDSHAWSTKTLPSDDPCHHPVDDGEPLPPVIDIGEPGANDLIRHACEKWGAFQVINHGVPLSLFLESEFQARRLFSLPMERKQLVARPPSGATGYGLTRISPFFPKLMWSEGFGMMGSPEEHARQLWPQDHAKFCEVMEQWQAEMKTLCEKIVGIMLGSLGLTNEEDMKWFEPKSGCDRTPCVLQLNSYPVCPDPDRAMGLAPHTDSSLITLLNQSNINGLQVYKDGAGWVSVKPVEGALVVNVGDLMHIVSNGKFKSVLHRAVVNKTCHRVSTAFFYGPPWDAKVSPLKKLVDSDHPPLYRPVKWKEYLQIKKTDFSSALESIRL